MRNSGLSSLALHSKRGELGGIRAGGFSGVAEVRRDIMPVGAVLSIALYILGKLGLYRAKLLNKTEPLRISTMIDVKV
jgi:hypothetical protein